MRYFHSRRIARRVHGVHCCAPFPLSTKPALGDSCQGVCSCVILRVVVRLHRGMVLRIRMYMEDQTPLSSRFVYSHTPYRAVAGWLPLRVTPNGQHNISSCSLERPRQHLILLLGCWRRSTGDLASLSSAKWRSQSIPIERQLMSCCSCKYQRSLCLQFHPEGASCCPSSTSAVYPPPHAQLTNTGRRVSPSPACSSVGLVELPKNIRVCASGLLPSIAP